MRKQEKQQQMGQKYAKQSLNNKTRMKNRLYVLFDQNHTTRVWKQLK